MLQALTPWEVATHVAAASRPGLLPERYALPLTVGAAVLITLALWPAFGAVSPAIGLVFGRLLALDLTTYTLPNIYTVPLLTMGLFHALTHEHLGSALIAGLLLMLLGRRNSRTVLNIGMGGGDLKLLAALFAFLPLTGAFWAIAVGSLLWLPVAFAKPRAMVPFGVPLILGWVVLLCLPHLPNWLISTIS